MHILYQNIERELKLPISLISFKIAILNGHPDIAHSFLRNAAKRPTDDLSAESGRKTIRFQINLTCLDDKVLVNNSSAMKLNSFSKNDGFRKWFTSYFALNLLLFTNCLNNYLETLENNSCQS